VTNQINVRCACGTHIGSHWCQMDWPEDKWPPEPTYTRSEIMSALEWAMDLIPDYVWERVNEGLDNVK
jgi:hypothetical protein